MGKVKISDIAKEFKLTSKDFIARLKESDFNISTRARTLTEAQAKDVRERWGEKKVSLVETRRGDVVEKRVKRSIIRRRKVEPKPEGAASGKAAPAVVEKPKTPVAAPKQKVAEAKTDVKPTKKAEKKEEKGYKPITKVKLFKPEPIQPLPAKKKPATPTPKETKAKVASTAGIEKKAARSGAPATATSREAQQQLDELAKRRKKAFIKKRAEEFDIKDFSRMERIYQPKKKRVIDRTKMKSTQVTTPKESKRMVQMGESIVISDLASQLKVKTSDVIKKLMKQGTMVTANQSIDVDTATLIASEFNFEVNAAVITEDSLLKREAPEAGDLKPRPPVVTVMGHVDHGKTTLLDAIRKTNVADGEAGGITQHIGAYMANVHGRAITFIDTPGHEAFSAMRARGAKTTDIVILIVAADDGVMPQTKEAVAHAKEAGVPIVVAINKIDKQGANPEKIKKELTELELVPEDWGGKTIFAEISAKNNKGIKELLEVLLIQADILELQASPSMLADGVVLEAKLAKGLGPVATVLVQEGTLKRGDMVVMGTQSGRVRLVLNDRGQQLKEATPAFAVEISGLDGVPEAGDHFYAFKSEQDARSIVQWRINKEKAVKVAPADKMTLEGLYEKMKTASVEEIKFVLKADVQGSVEVVKQTISKLSMDKIKMNVIYSGVGAISESDVNLADASNAILIGFNIRPDRKAKELVKVHKVDLRLYTVIYDVAEDLKKAMVGRLEPTVNEKVIGQAEVRNIFKVSKVGTIAGCMVTEGKVTRTAEVRLLRDNKVIHTGKITSLKRFKNDAREVQQGYECGITIEGYNDVKEGDVIEAFIKEEVAATL